MKTVSQIRRENLLKLAKQCGSQRELADRLGRSAQQVGQWIRQTPDSKTGQPRVVSNSMAREIERAFGKPEGWMDLDQDAPLAIQPDAEVLELAFKAVRQYETRNDLVLDMKQKAVLVSALYVHIASGADQASEAIGQAIRKIQERAASM